MKRRILVVEDEPLIADAVSFALEREAFDVTVAPDAATALARAAEGDWELVVLDLALPDRPGLEVCRALRSRGAVPIVILTARDTEADRVLGLESGADDYVAKPFSMPELVARVRALLRRRELDRADAASGVRRIGDLRVDLPRHEVAVAGEPVHLTRSEFALLALLSERPGTVVSRREIVSRLWSSEHVGDTRVCDTYVARLRKKLEADPSRPARILTVRGRGYRLAAS